MDRRFVSTVLAVGLAGSVGAQDAVQWRNEVGGNGHWYRRVPRQSRDWNQLRMAAFEIGATLATIGSAGENEHMRSLLGGELAMIGGLREGGACGSPWTWIDGTPFEFQQWDPGQPQCWGEEIIVSYPSGVWHDFPRDPISIVTSAIFEWSADCNGDGVVDFGQIRDGTLPDANGNGVPDVCDPCPSDIDLNGVVDGVDLAVILARWGPVPKDYPRADCNRDGIVDAGDLGIVLGGWGPCLP